MDCKVSFYPSGPGSIPGRGLKCVSWNVSSTNLNLITQRDLLLFFLLMQDYILYITYTYLWLHDITNNFWFT